MTSGCSRCKRSGFKNRRKSRGFRGRRIKEWMLMA